MMKSMQAAVGLGVMAVVLLASRPGIAAVPSQWFPDGVPTLAPMVESVTPAVVNIATSTRVAVRNPLQDDPFFRRFFNVPAGPRYRQTHSAGSGVILDPVAGYIITNNHVVDGADEIAITLADGRTFPARLVGRDAQVDIALLQVQAENLDGIALGDSAAMRVGDFVLAIGNPFGLGQTVTSGMVSGVGRTGLGFEGYEDLIQTDAPINPGNSGGALVNLRGELVGINTAILSPSGGNVGIGFAIPSNVVRAIADQIIKHGEVRRGHIGLSVQPLNPDLAKAFNLDRSRGVVVVRVEPDSAADRGGIQPGDVILRIGSTRIDRQSNYHSVAAVMMVGDSANVELLRQGKPLTVRLEIGEDSYEIVQGDRIHPFLGGAALTNNRSYQDPDVAAGVVIASVAGDSLSWRYGLRRGDVIVAANRAPVLNLSDLHASVDARMRQLLLRVWREGSYYFVSMP